MPHRPKFTEGSTMWHIVNMTATGAVGLMFMFMVDLVDMLFLSMLGQREAVAAVGFAATILFFTISMGIAVSIAATALVSRAIGAGDVELAKRRAVNVVAFGALFSTVMVYFLWPLAPHLLLFLGAGGRTLDLATSYLQILILGMPAVMMGMIGSGIMRALGDAKRAMYATLVSGAVNAILDPILIFGFGLGVEGAAIASLIGRFSMVGVAWYGVVRVHKMLAQFDLVHFAKDLGPISVIALPAMLTNMSSPLANAIVTEHMSDFGDHAVAGMSIIGRVIPVVFGGLFALSGAVGPILGQNYGALKFERMQRTLINAGFFSLLYTIALCVLLYSLQDWLVEIFNATGETASLVHFFSSFVAFTFFFQGLLFVSIAAFNNLGRPHYSTLLNLGRATVGTWPLIWVFSIFMGAEGILVGQGVGSILFGCIGFRMAQRYVVELSSRTHHEIQVDDTLSYDEVA